MQIEFVPGDAQLKSSVNFRRFPLDVTAVLGRPEQRGKRVEGMPWKDARPLLAHSQWSRSRSGRSSRATSPDRMMTCTR